jgi:diguanylate cyclase (GGDEF)-like protein/PAS domain S-box-containing protein
MGTDTNGGGRPPVRRGRFRLTRRVFWDLAVYMVGLGLSVGLVFPPFAVALGVPSEYANRLTFWAACLAAGFLVGALSYALCRCVVGGRLADLGLRLRSAAEGITHASRTGDWSQAASERIHVDSDDQLGDTARAFNSLLDALEAGEHFRSLVRNASDVITVVDPSGRIAYQTPSISTVLGYGPAALVGSNMKDLVHPDDVATFEADLAVLAAGNLHGSSGFRLRHYNGTWRWMETAASNLLHDPAVNGLVLTTRDVSDRKELEDRLHTQAYYDGLTGLGNRALFMDRLRAAEKSGRDEGTPATVLFLDLDNLKTVNDNLGHDSGDALLKAVAARISACLRPTDTLARLAGDEFAILLVGPDGNEEAARVGERILASMRESLLLGDQLFHVGISIGIATSSTCAASGIDLLSAADVAMYVAKANGKGRCEVFQPSHHASALEREGLLADLHLAVDRDELLLHYQPIVNLFSGEVSGYEALLRWQHPERGIVPPADFITLAEESGLIVPIGRWVLREATRQAAAWQSDSSERRLRMSVNVSVRQFEDPDLLDDLADILRTSGLDPKLLTLEITESLFLRKTQSVTQKLQQIGALGIRLALDDFGTGYSSLSYLRRFPIDVLKIDKSFVGGIAANIEDRAVIGAIVQLGQTLRLDLVAEGIEDAEELEILRSLGVHYGQGFHLGRPGPDQVHSEVDTPSAPESSDATGNRKPLPTPPHQGSWPSLKKPTDNALSKLPKAPATTWMWN